MPKLHDRTNERYGRWLVIKPMGYNREEKPRRSLWLCRCECGTERVMNSQVLQDKASQSCGCLHKERVSASSKTHGLSKTRLYKQWMSMKTRCLIPSCKVYHLYGGRGITVCDEWIASFEAFAKYVGEKPVGKSLDRIDNNGDYKPGNVRWATQSEQMGNTRNSVLLTLNGETLCVKEWSKRLGIYYNTLNGRVKKGWTDEEVLTRPVDKNLRRNYKRLDISSTDSL